MTPIREAVQLELLKAELTAERFLRVTRKGENEIYVINCHNSPNVLEEIGRLREVTFREVGEGTNESIDLDKYDQYYHHMFLWDDETKQIAGAYRMGLGSEIFPKYGMEGFYLNDLFDCYSLR